MNVKKEFEQRVDILLKRYAKEIADAPTLWGVVIPSDAPMIDDQIQYETERRHSPLLDDILRGWKSL
jgi:hypothetical protein